MDKPKSREPRRPDAPRLMILPSPLPPEWNGWQITGNYLIAPDGQKLHQRRVVGLAWRENMELRRAGYASRKAAEAAKSGRQYGVKVKVIVIDLGEYRVHGLSAG